MTGFLWRALFLSVATMPTLGQTNLISNPNADLGTSSRKIYGEAKVEEGKDEDPYFALRNGSHIIQMIKLDNAAGKFALLMGRGKMEQSGKDHFSGPSLDGYLLSTYFPYGSNKINTYMNGQSSMTGRPSSPDQWPPMYGIFEVPADTVAAQVTLWHAQRKGESNDGSATKFDNLGFYLFDTKQEALAFAKKYLQ